ncbi:MAG TPA: carboxypeptidase regulatory-like domain-containing protein [Gemmatimonadales bacterium]|nr:carboxypeptidase regulatory-like domain-containing protein [Gemmatimonadales bacterium]
MFRSTSRAWAAAALIACVLSCSKGEKAPPADGAPAQSGAAPNGPLGTATVTGKVTFLGKAPENPPIDMSAEAACKAAYPTTPHQPIVVVNPNGTLANVFVYVKTGLPPDARYTPPATPVTIDQQGCLYHPRVFGIMVGQTLAIKNSDQLLHNIKALGKLNRPFNISQPTANMTTDRTFAATEVMLPFECNVHGWMHAYAGVLPHPFFATTGTDGTFTIANLPAGTYTLEFWHEQYGTREVTVTVADHETKTVDVRYGTAKKG